jgi:hypothetical protein
MGAVNTGLPLEALQLFRAFDGEIILANGTVIGSTQELHAFLDRLESRPISPVEDDEAELDAALATRGCQTTRASNRGSRQSPQNRNDHEASP